MCIYGQQMKLETGDTSIEADREREAIGGSNTNKK